LSVQPSEAKGALAVAAAQRAFLGDCDLNLWQPDIYHGALEKGLDFVGEFNRPRFGVCGKVWVEIKAFTAASFDLKLSRAKEEVEKEFPALQRKDKSFGAAMLLVAKVERAAGTSWEKLRMFAELYVDGSWLDVGPSTGRPAGAGRLLAGRKPTMAAVWRKMEKVTLAESDVEVGFLSHSLKEVGLADGNPGKRAATFNKILESHQAAGRVEQKRVELHPGQWPYVPTKATFQVILKSL